MFLHLGMDVVVPQSEVIAILDLETTSISRITKEFLNKSQKQGKVIAIGNDLPKSYIITGKRQKLSIYISPISVQTLAKRASHNAWLSSGDN